MLFSIEKVFAQLKRLSFGRERALSVQTLGKFLVHKTCYSKYSLTFTLLVCCCFSRVCTFRFFSQSIMSVSASLLQEIVPAHTTPHGKITVVGVGQVGMACAFTILQQVSRQIASARHGQGQNPRGDVVPKIPQKSHSIQCLSNFFRLMYLTD
jgi:hypothetical protein